MRVIIDMLISWLAQEGHDQHAGAVECSEQGSEQGSLLMLPHR